jgi:hypothetical protein
MSNDNQEVIVDGIVTAGIGAAASDNVKVAVGEGLQVVESVDFSRDPCITLVDAGTATIVELGFDLLSLTREAAFEAAQKAREAKA